MSSLRTVVRLLAQQKLYCGCGLKVGDQVSVDGLQGRGVITARMGRRLTVKFRNGMTLQRDQRSVHPLSDNTYKSEYQSQ